MVRISGVLLLLVLLSGCTGRQTPLTGEQIYMMQCASCHRGDGQGLAGIYPPLAGSPWVTGDPDRLMLTVIHGLKGPVEIKGQVYQGVMPAHQRRLRPEEIAAVLNFIRTAWGNAADSISVESVRRHYALQRDHPWTEEALKAHLARP